MTFVNEATKRREALTRSQAERFAQVLAPFAPHLAEELWERLGHDDTPCHRRRLADAGRALPGRGRPSSWWSR